MNRFRLTCHLSAGLLGLLLCAGSLQQALGQDRVDLEKSGLTASVASKIFRDVCLGDGANRAYVLRSNGFLETASVGHYEHPSLDILFDLTRGCAADFRPEESASITSLAFYEVAEQTLGLDGIPTVLPGNERVPEFELEGPNGIKLRMETGEVSILNVFVPSERFQADLILPE